MLSLQNLSSIFDRFPFESKRLHSTEETRTENMKFSREIRITLLSALVLGLYLTIVLRQANVAKDLFAKRVGKENQVFFDDDEDEEEEHHSSKNKKIYVDPRHDYTWRRVLSEGERTATEAIPPQVVII